MVSFKFSCRRMASFCRGRRMKIVLITYCLFFVNQSKISTARERLVFNVTISFTTSVKHALAHRCSLNFTKVKLDLSNKVNIRSLQNIQQRRGRHWLDLCKGTKQKKKVNFNVQTKQQLCTCITRFDTFRCILCTQFRTQTTRYFPNIQLSPEGEVNSSGYRFGKYWYYCPQSPLFVSNSAERLCGRDIKYWAYVLRPRPPLSVYFLIRKCFFPDSKIYTSTSSVHTYTHTFFLVKKVRKIGNVYFVLCYCPSIRIHS